MLIVTELDCDYKSDLYLAGPLAPEPDLTEVKNSIDKLKNCKVPGEEESQLITAISTANYSGGETLIEKLHILILLTYESSSSSVHLLASMFS